MSFRAWAARAGVLAEQPRGRRGRPGTAPAGGRYRRCCHWLPWRLGRARTAPRRRRRLPPRAGDPQRNRPVRARHDRERLLVPPGSPPSGSPARPGSGHGRRAPGGSPAGTLAPAGVSPSAARASPMVRRTFPRWTRTQAMARVAHARGVQREVIQLHGSLADRRAGRADARHGSRKPGPASGRSSSARHQPRPRNPPAPPARRPGCRSSRVPGPAGRRTAAPDPSPPAKRCWPASTHAFSFRAS